MLMILSISRFVESLFCFHLRLTHVGVLIFSDPMPQMDVSEANKQFMDQSEELYDALIECHWQPLDSVSSQIQAV